MNKLKVYVVYAYLAVLAYLPFHAPLSTWAISTWGNAIFFKAFKDVLLIGISATAVYAWRHELGVLRAQRLFRAIAVYVGIQVLWTLLSSAEWDARLAGILMNIRFIAGFLVAYILATQARLKYETVIRTVTVPFIGVVLFGVLQWFVLPIDILRHIGYGTHTIPPYMTIDSNQQYVRILSTLRGPNPLGAYLAALAVPVIVYIRQQKTLFVSAVIAAGVLLVLYASGSRSAWLGMFVALAVFVYVRYRHFVTTKVSLWAVVFVVACSLGVYQLRHTPIVARAVFHSDVTDSNSYNSDNNRLATLATAVTDIVHEPLGRGVGTSGLASTYNTHNSRVTENYFLQVGEEVGIFGLALLVYIVAAITKRLMKMSSLSENAIAAGWLALVIIALLWPAYGDETTSIIVWSLAGMLLAKQNRPVTVKRKHVAQKH